MQGTPQTSDKEYNPCLGMLVNFASPGTQSNNIDYCTLH